jgi:tRNA (guanine-N7-)-methyltransferase
MTAHKNAIPTDKPLRRVRTFMARASALNTTQKFGMDEYAPRLLQKVADVTSFDSKALFGREAPVTLEIGFGMGFSIIEMAENMPERDFVGIEIHTPGIAQLVYEAGARKLDNVRVFDGDALLLLEHHVPDASLDTVQLFFPDPWQKTKHYKRRLVQTENAELIRRKLKIGGVFHMATDWANYAEWMLEIMEAAPGYENCAGAGNYSERPATRPLTKFEERGKKMGHGVWDLLYRRVV